MKTISKITGVIAVSALLVTGITSCKKEKFTTENATNSEISDKEDVSNEKIPVYYAGIRSNEGYPTIDQTNIGDYRLQSNAGPSQLPIVTYSFGGNYIVGSVFPSVMVGYASSGFNDVVAYRAASNIIYINSNNSSLCGLVYTTTGAFFNGNIEEIEIDPATGILYALCKGSAITIYRFDNDFAGNYTAVQLTNFANGSPNFFNNVLGNGYKSGSICFVPNEMSGKSPNMLVFTHESNVYSTAGLKMWKYSMTPTGNQLEALLPAYQTSNNSSAIPGALTGKINTAYGDGKFYFARDNGNLFTINIATTNSTVLPVTSTPIQNKNDFGYYKNF